MTDYTSEVAELEAAYRANRVANATIVADVRAKYKAQIAREVAALKEDNDRKFAEHLKEVKERTGIPLSVIQDEVLHTRTWSAWTKWRDLADIPPERVVVANARADRAKADAPAVWAVEDNLFYVHVDKDGNRLAEPVAYTIDSIVHPLYDLSKWWARPVNSSAEREHGTGLILHGVIQSAMDNGTLNKEDYE